MSNFFLTPNMNLVIPVPGSDPGPDWSNNLNASLSTVDGHSHAPGSGVAITPAGLNINADLSFQTNNATLLTSVRFNNLTSALASSSPNIGCLYEVAGDLYYNDTSANQIRMTQGGAVAGSSGTITGLPSGTASAAYSSANKTFTFQQSTATGANLDIASLIIRYPGAYPTPSGNYILLEAPSSLSSGYALTLPAVPAQTNVMTLGSTGIMASVSWNAVAQNRTRATGSTVGLGGVATSASCGSYNTNSGSFQNITNLSVTITTSGRPIAVGFIASPGTSNSFVGINTGGFSFQYGLIAILNGATAVMTQELEWENSLAVRWTVPSSSIQCIDFQNAGTYTYTAQALANGVLTLVENVSLYAYEL